MARFLVPSLLAVTLAGSLACGDAGAALRTASELQPARAAAAASASLASTQAPKVVRLEAPAPAETGVLAAAISTGREQIGFGRAVAALRSAPALLRELSWAPLGAERQVAAVAITSPGAAGLRVALRMGAVPRGTRLRFASATGSAVQVDAQDVQASVARNLYYDEDTPAAHLYWSPVIDGETAVLEIEMPRTASGADLQLAVPLVSHLVVPAARAGRACAANANACEDDLGPADGAAFARIVFTEGGATYACNGMLVADRDPETMIPFFLTARHCISSQSAASTVQPFWPRNPVACDAGSVTLTPGGQGATLLHGDAGSDLSLIRLQQAPPVGASYAGWVVAASAANPQDATREAGLVKVAVGDDAARAAAPLPVVPASQLGECTPEGGASARFAAAYNAGLYQWLGGMPQDTRDEAAPGGS
jgi:hypothetical protein